MHAAAELDIEYLQRWYAKATDLIGTNDPDALARGREIYHRIFTPDVEIRTAGMGDEPLVSSGPDGWVDVVLEALTEYSATQHLIGTQIAEVEQLELDDAGEVTAGDAHLESYLQAWHETLSAGTVWVFLGTYTSKVRYTPGVGWQIYDMTLTQVSTETRALGTL